MSFSQTTSPSLQFPFNGSNVESITGITPSLQNLNTQGTGALRGSAVYLNGTAPTSNSAVYFPGTSGSYMNLGTTTSANFDITADNMFIEAWVNFNSVGSAQSIVAKVALITGSSTAADNNWRFLLDSTGQINFLVSDGTTFLFATSTGTVTAGIWTHIAISYLKNTGVYFFINGSLSGQASLALTPTSRSLPILIGVGASNNIRFNGYLQDLRVIQGGTVPTTSFTPGIPPFSQYTRPSYATGGRIVYTLQYQFSPFYTTGLLGQQAVYLNNSTVTLFGTGSAPATSNIVYNTSTLSTAAGMTISVWVNIQATTPGANYDKGYFLALGANLLLFIRGGRQLTVFFSGVELSIPQSATAGTWYHMVAVISNPKWYIYINGILNTTSSTAYSDTTFNQIFLGCAASGQTSADTLVQDLRIYNTALSAIQIQALYANGGSPGVPASTNFTVTNTTRQSTLSGGSIRDFSPSPLTLTTYGTPVSVPNSPFINDGSFIPAFLGSSYFIPASVSKLNFDFFSSSSNSFCELWVYFSGTDFSTYPSFLVRNTSTATNGDVDWAFGTNPISASGVQIGMFFNGGGASRNRVGPSGMGSVFMQSKQWNHVTMSWETPNVAGGTGNVCISVNGTVTVGTRNLTTYPSLYTAASGVSISGQVWGSDALFSNFRIVNLGLNPLPYKTTYMVPTSPLGVFAKGTTALLIRVPNPTTTVLSDYSANPINLTTYATDMTYVPTVPNGLFSSRPLEGSFLPTIFTDTCQFPTTLTKLNYDFFSASSNSFMEFWWFAPVKTTTYSRFWMRSTGSSGNINTWGDFQLSISPSPGAAGLVAATGVTTQVSLASQNYNLNAWNHISLSWNFTNTTAYISMNGVVSSLSLASRSTQYLSTSPISFCTQFDPDSLISNFRVVSGPATLPYISSFTPSTAPLGIYPSGTTVLLLRAVSPGIQMTGASLFSQIPSLAQSSAVGAFSLRAVNGVTAKAVNVVRYPVVQWPPVAMTSNATVVTGQAYGNGTYFASEPTGQSNTSTTATFNMFDTNINTIYEQNTQPTGGPFIGNYYYNSGTSNVANSPTTTISSQSALGWWVQIQSPTSFILRNYTIVGRQDNNFWTNRAPDTFWIAGSTDGSTWSNVHFKSGATYPITGTNFTVPSTSNSIAYSYYRMVVAKLNGNTDILNIASWNLYGDSPSYTTGSSDFYADRLGNLLTAPVTGINLASWLGGATGYVATWYDQSGKGNKATQTTQSNRPTITLDASNRYQMDFSVPSFFNATNGTIPMQTAYTVICRYNTIGNTNGGICGGGTNATSQTNNFRRNVAGYQNYWWNNDVNTSTGYGVGNVVTFIFKAEASPTSGNTFIYSNGTTQTVTGNPRSGWSAVQGNEVIGRTILTNETMQGQMYSLFLFNSALSDNDRIAVENAS